MRKGFIHIVEIIVISMMAFFLLVQFYQIPKQQEDWVKTEISAQANDILFILDRKDVNWFSPTGVDSKLRSFASNNTAYNLKIRNAPKPLINVGCICSEAEAAAIMSILQYFEINNQGVNFSVTRIPPSSIAFSHEHDVIVVFDYDLVPYFDQIRQFLSAGKGLVEIRNLDQAPEIDFVQSELFGLEWNAALPLADSNPIEFRSSSSSEPYYNIYKYFHNLPLYQQNFSSGDSGWTESGSWSIDSQTYLGDSSGYPEAISYYNPNFEDTYSMRASLRLENANANAKIMVYRQDSGNYVSIEMNDSSDRIIVWDNVSGTANSKGLAGYTIIPGRWYDVKIAPQADGTLKIYVNGSLSLTSQPVTIRQSSRLGFNVEGGSARFDNIFVTFSEIHNFSVAGPPITSKVQPSDGDMLNIILFQGKQLPFCIANSNIIGDKGRTAWLAPFDLNLPATPSQQMGSMIRSLVVWVSGEENEIIKDEIKKVPVVTSIYKSYDQDMYQLVEIVLSMGNLYG